MTPQINVDESRCKRCGICIDACPIPCFYQAGKEVKVFNEDLCLVCRNCEESCPSTCVRVMLGNA